MSWVQKAAEPGTEGISLEQALLANGVRGNFLDAESGDEYWVSGVKKRGSNAHWAEPVTIVVDEDARAEYEKIKYGEPEST